MPLPNDPTKVEDWKRRISRSVRMTKQSQKEFVLEEKLDINTDVDLSSLSNKQLIMLHVKLHAYYKNRTSNQREKTITELHTDLVKELEKRKLRHPFYDNLDKASKVLTDETRDDDNGKKEKESK